MKDNKEVIEMKNAEYKRKVDIAKLLGVEGVMNRKDFWEVQNEGKPPQDGKHYIYDLVRKDWVEVEEETDAEHEANLKKGE